MEHISKVLQEHSLQSTLAPKTFNYSRSEDDPDYKEPSLAEKRAEWLLKYGGITDLNNTFDKMRCPKGFKPTIDAFKELAAGMASWYMLMVYGGTGNGKTLCCQALVIALYDHSTLRQMHTFFP